MRGATTLAAECVSGCVDMVLALGGDRLHRQTLARVMLGRMKLAAECWACVGAVLWCRGLGCRETMRNGAHSTAYRTLPEKSLRERPERTAGAVHH